jgi:hypothetical protein
MLNDSIVDEGKFEVKINEEGKLSLVGNFNNVPEEERNIVNNLMNNANDLFHQIQSDDQPLPGNSFGDKIGNCLSGVAQTLPEGIPEEVKDQTQNMIIHFMQKLSNPNFAIKNGLNIADVMKAFQDYTSKFRYGDQISIEEINSSLDTFYDEIFTTEPQSDVDTTIHMINDHNSNGQQENPNIPPD